MIKVIYFIKFVFFTIFVLFITYLLWANKSDVTIHILPELWLIPDITYRLPLFILLTAVFAFGILTSIFISFIFKMKRRFKK